MSKPYLIVGHGLAGCVLALTFLRNKIPFTLAGTSINGEASMASSGLITPVTGRKYVKSWMIDEFIDEAIGFYAWTEELLGGKYFFPVEIIRFLSHSEALQAWNKRSEDTDYARYISNKRFEEIDRLEKPYGVLTGGYRLDAPGWLKIVRSFLSENGMFEERFVELSEQVEEYEAIIFATGAVGHFVSGGLIPNKGEALIVKMPQWKFPAIIKEEVFFVPLKEEDMFWVGSYYQPWPDNPGPSAEGKMMLMKAIEEVYKDSFMIIDHVAGVRPTVDDRRPLIGLYPGYEKKYIFNGMGTKGTSLAPYWANHLVSHIIKGAPIMRIVRPERYTTQQSG